MIGPTQQARASIAGYRRLSIQSYGVSRRLYSKALLTIVGHLRVLFELKLNIGPCTITSAGKISSLQRYIAILSLLSSSSQNPGAQHLAVLE